MLRSSSVVFKALLFASICTAVPQLMACSDDSSDEEDGAGAVTASGGSAGTSVVNLGGNGTIGGSTGSGGGAVVSNGGGNQCMIEDDGSGCVGQAFEGESIPLDIYIMFDQSGSMCSCVDPVIDGAQACPNPDCNQTRMDAVRTAANLFMADPQSLGIGVGIGYFGKQTIGQASCETAEYTTPAVEIGILPDHAGAITASLDGIAPTGETPSGAAIRGACDYASTYKADHPGHEVVILLLTDGKPEAPVTCAGGGGPCCPTLEDAVAAATDCLGGDPGVKTYVLGVGPLLGNLADIAEAGGTGDAYLVEGGDVQNQVLNALNQIRGDAIPCTLQLPPPPDGSDLNYAQVNITYANAACEPSYYYSVETFEACGPDGGWYYEYDEATGNPGQIQLCPTSCDQVSVPGGKLLYTVGCATRYIPK